MNLHFTNHSNTKKKKDHQVLKSHKYKMPTTSESKWTFAVTIKVQKWFLVDRSTNNYLLLSLLLVLLGGKPLSADREGPNEKSKYWISMCWRFFATNIKAPKTVNCRKPLTTSHMSKLTLVARFFSQMMKGQSIWSKINPDCSKKWVMNWKFLQDGKWHTENNNEEKEKK